MAASTSGTVFSALNVHGVDLRCQHQPYGIGADTTDINLFPSWPPPFSLSSHLLCSSPTACR